MFEKRKKLDPKIKFQQRRFRSQLQNARTYKREGRKISENSLERFFAKIGLGNVLIKIGVVVILGGILYLIYIPNFLFIKRITIVGGSTDQNQKTLHLANEYFRLKPAKAQQNIIFLSSKDLQGYLLSHEPSILKIRQVKKIFPNSLSIQLEPRTVQFLVETSTGLFSVSSDGIVQQPVASELTTSTPYQSMLHITLSGPSPLIGQKVFSDQTLQMFGALNVATNSTLKTTVVKFEVEETDAPDILEYVSDGYTLYLDINSDVQKTFDQIKLILDNTSDSQKKKLFYIDMRIPDKGFACYSGTPCSLPPPSPQQSTSTPATTTPIN